MDEIEEQKIEKMYMQNVTPKKIAEILDRDVSTIRSYIIKEKLESKRIEAIDKKFMKLIKTSMTCEQIADTLHVNKNYLYIIIKRNKLNINFEERKKNIYNKKKQVREDNVLKEYSKGIHSINLIAQKLNYSYAIVKDVFKTHNLQNVGSGSGNYFYVLSKEKYQEILYKIENTSKSLAEIGREYNVSRQHIFAIMKKNNIERKKR